MFNKIYNNPNLASIISSYCDENDIEICLDESLESNSDDKLLILKIDDYYSSKKIHNPPPAIDCLILVKCDSGECYDIYLVELKNIKSPKAFSKENIVEKFKTTINKFLNDEYTDIFLKENYCDFNCYFVTNPYGCQNITQEEYDKKIHDEGLKLDFFNSIKPFKFQNKYSLIKPILPNPTINEC